MAEIKGVVPRPVRICRICPVCVREEGRVPHRRFFFSEAEADAWSCPDHGQAVTQESRPYSPPLVP
jgi:hypothetical protein